MHPPWWMRTTNSFPALLFFATVAGGVALAYGLYGALGPIGAGALVVIATVLAALIARAVRVAAPWERAIVLRLGKFRGLRGPGLFALVPIIDTIPYWIDIRVIT